MSCTEQTVFLMTLCLSRFSNKQHSLWLIRKEWPPHRPYTDPRRLAHQPISPFISPECLLCFVCPVPRVPEANLRGRTDVKLQWKCVYRLSGDETNTPLWKHTHGQTHTETNVKDARWFIMSVCSGVVIFKMGVRHVFALPHLISGPFTFNSDYLKSQHLKLNRWIKTTSAVFLFCFVCWF